MRSDRCLIIYLDANGLPRIWTLSADPEQDDDKTLKKHFDENLKPYRPGIKYLGHYFGDITDMVQALRDAAKKDQ